MEKFKNNSMNRFNRFHFDGQKPQEKIFLVLHRHWFNILSQLFVIFFMLLLLFGSYVFSFYFYSALNMADFESLIAFLRNLFFLLLWMIFFLIWIDYYFDVWIVTDQRIVNIEQKGLFARTISELELEKIQDITSDVKEVIPTFFNFGDLYVQTAAEQERFLFRNIPDPYSVKDLIMKLQNKAEQKEENEFRELINKKIRK
jgi:hypothetical protein